ncbi:MAG: UPF0146 family protein, partial [Methanoregula sp.]|nr:UPF0146 family protein [Methanoregula sp.]
MPYTPAQIYAPAEDTHLLLFTAQREVSPNDRVLEVGTGSGIIATAVAKVAASVVATDINPFATVHAHAHGTDVIRTDLFAGLK